jgi:HPr kinase/phosphorylase
MRTPLMSSTFIEKVSAFLEEALTDATSLHGVLMDVFGVGILLLGKSGIGKSEIALDLIMRGHRLVADDIVEVTKRKEGTVHGSGNPIIKHHMEIRGLGIINIKDLFGVAAVRDRKKVELVIELVEWDPEQEYDRLGLKDRFFSVLSVDLPLSTLPVRPGRNLTTLIEVASRNHLLKLQGHHSAKDFAERLNRAIAAGAMRRPLRDEVE